MKELYIEKLPNHAPLAVSIVLRDGRRPSSFTKRAVAEFMREHGIEELEAYYGKEAVEGALQSPQASERDAVEPEDSAGVPEQVETEPLDAGVGVQSSEAGLPPKPKKKRGRKAKKGKSLIK